MTPKDKQYRAFTCTIHNVEVKVEKHPAHEIACCPYCTQEKWLRDRRQLEVVTEHRNALLRAIEIKQTVETING